LNSSGGASATKSAYAGAAKGFKITLTGTVATGQKIRIMYASTATPPAGTSPYKEVTGVGTYSVLFSDVSCPSWATTAAQCPPLSGSAAYSIQVQIAGGSTATDAVGAFSNLCITSITPL
jgi:hypothetical protein